MHTKGRNIFYLHQLGVHYTFINTHNQIAAVPKNKVLVKFMPPSRQLELPRQNPHQTPYHHPNMRKDAHVLVLKLTIPCPRGCLIPSPVPHITRNLRQKLRHSLRQDITFVTQENGGKEEDGCDQKNTNGTDKEAQTRPQLVKGVCHDLPPTTREERESDALQPLSISMTHALRPLSMFF